MKIAVRSAIMLAVLGAAVPAYAIRPAPKTRSQKQAETQAEQQPQQQQPAQPQMQTASGIRPSPQAQKALIDLQTAVNANDTANIPARVAAAQAVAQTNADRYLIAQLQLRAAVNANNNAAASQALEAIAASGVIAGPQLGELYASLGQKLYQEKQYAEAARLIERASALSPANKDLALLLGDAQLAGGNKAAAMATYQKLLQAQRAAGGKPSEDLYRRVVQAAYDAKAPGAADLAREWVSAYPSPLSWRNSIGIYRNLNKPDLESTLDLFRLMRAANAMDANDLSVYLTLLSDQSNFIEAQTALEQVQARNGQVQTMATSLNSKPRPSEADLLSAVKGAQTGAAVLRIGDRLYGLGSYAKAAEVYAQAKARGVDANLVAERTGVALARAGDKAGAINAFKSVTGARSGVAQMWLIYLGNVA